MSNRMNIEPKNKIGELIMNRIQSLIDRDFSKGLNYLLEEGRNLQKDFPPFHKEGEKEEDVLKKAKDKFVQRVESCGNAICKAQSDADAGIYNQENVEKYRQLKEICESITEK